MMSVLAAISHRCSRWIGFRGPGFGAPTISGEVVFNTGMVDIQKPPDGPFI
jgi:hypothetical protein